ncbi:MAG TPA: hypothetical protein VI997_00660 [Candidatus Thermoplasmatota archaeon]|nr:hypothetical protein [Candidatus Thermoplasmatota archaeon]
MRFAVVVAALASAAAAGCAVPADSPSDEVADAAPPTAHAWGLAECAYVIAVVPVDPARLAEHLPEGFAPAPSLLRVLPAGPRSSIELDAYHCASGVALDGAALADVSYGSYYTAVAAPEELEEDGYDAVFVKWDFLVPDETRRATLVAGGLPARGGSSAVAVTAAPAGGVFVEAVLALDDGGGFALRGVASAPDTQDEPLPFMEYTPLDRGGLARWHARLHDATFASGEGVVEIAPGWVRDVVGADRAPATFIAGDWNLDEADLAFPIEWPPS